MRNNALAIVGAVKGVENSSVLVTILLPGQSASAGTLP
jgi:hypothetical protein